MVCKIVFKDFRSNLKNNIFYFVANSMGVAEFFIFLGLDSVIMEVMVNGTTGETGIYDSVIALGGITLFTTALMVYSMLNYMKVRIRNYSLFVMIGMRKRMMYAMITFEYLTGWVFSTIIGLVAGTRVLYAVLELWHKMFPKYVGEAKIRTSVYGMACGVSLGIMAAVFFILLIWANSKDLSSLTAEDDKKEKRPRSMHWLIMIFLGFALFGIGFLQYSGSVVGGWPYVYSHFSWIAGGFLVMAFGFGMLLEKLYRQENFYIDHLLQINRLYTKFQSNLLILLMILSVSFFALTYCVAGVVELLPLGDNGKNYPYDAVWMAQEHEEDERFGEMLAKKYHGAVKSLPMIRVSNYFDSEQIGISASSYKMLTGIDSGLTEREIICAVSSVKSPPGKNIAFGMYKELNEWLVPGKLTDELYQQIWDPNGKIPGMDVENLFQVKKVHSQNWFGEYGIDSYCEDAIVFSDEYFKEQREYLLKDPEEATVLKMFMFPEKQRREAVKELKEYVAEYGVEDSGWAGQSSLYITEETVEEIDKSDIFKLTNKLFIMGMFFSSGMLALMIKTLSELPYYRKRYEFLDCMGIRRHMREKTISIEIQSIPSIAAVTAAILSAPYLKMHMMREDSRGNVLDGKIWLYWAVVIFGYLIVQYIAQRFLVMYMNHRLKKGV